MNMILQMPKEPGALEALSRRAAAVHAHMIVTSIQKLPCPKEQKLYLMGEIIRALQEPLG